MSCVKGVVVVVPWNLLHPADRSKEGVPDLAKRTGTNLKRPARVRGASSARDLPVWADKKKWGLYAEGKLKPTVSRSQLGITDSNRRVRTRTHGGVAGVGG
jgi:hypothetical protein